MNIVLGLVIALNVISDATSLYCYWNTGCPYKFLSSKTPYVAVRSDIRDSIVKLTGCEPVSIWGLARHGKIYPSIESGQSMKEAAAFRDYVVTSYDRGSSSLCAQDVDNLRTWKVDSNFGQTHQLSQEGTRESEGIGKRLKQAFPKLLEKLDKENYTFRPASGNWIEDTAKAFINGLQNEQLVLDSVKEDYDIMTPYRNCKKYQEQVLETKTKTYAETNKYYESSEFLVMKDRLHRRLGIDFPLSNANITALYDWCRYTWSGTENKISPWCAIFTTQDLKVLEYVEDLNSFYENGYGNSISPKLGMIPIADLLEKFQEVKEGKGKNIVMYFTEDSMIEMVYTALNLFRDNKALTGARIIPDRKWRNSKISPYSSNLLAVLNRCKANDFNVVFYLNEEPLIPICKDGVCTWQEFENKLKSFADANTDFCENE